MSFNQPPTPLPRESLDMLLRELFGARHTATAELLTDGVRNLNYRIDRGGAETLVLRIYCCDPQACRKEAHLLDELRSQLPVPEVVEAHPEGLLGVRPFTVLRYVEGITFRELRRTGNPESIASAAHAIGRVAASIGRSKFAAAKPATIDARFNTRCVLEELHACLASPVLGKRLAGPLRRRIESVAAARPHDLACVPPHCGLVHGDFGNRNVIVRCNNGAWSVAAVVDWESAGSGPPLWDIAGFLQYEHLLRPSREPHFSRGYTDAGGILPENWRQVAHVMNLARQCELLAHAAVPQAIVAEVVDLIREKLDEEHLGGLS